jgi:hypothetical protein
MAIHEALIKNTCVPKTFVSFLCNDEEVLIRLIQVMQWLEERITTAFFSFSRTLPSQPLASIVNK